MTNITREYGAGHRIDLDIEAGVGVLVLPAVEDDIAVGGLTATMHQVEYGDVLRDLARMGFEIAVDEHGVEVEIELAFAGSWSPVVRVEA